MKLEPRCKNCLPPERHPGCHSECKWYKEWKEEYDKRKKREKDENWLQHIGMKSST